MAAYSDWVACPSTCQSITGYCVYLGKNLISWQTRKQHTVSKSSAETEYHALSTTSCEITWLGALFDEINDTNSSKSSTGKPKWTPHLYTDSSSVTSIAKNLVSHQRTKHIEIDVHFVSDKVLTGKIKLGYVPTKENPADTFTKPLPGSTFEYLLPKLHLMDVCKPNSPIVINLFQSFALHARFEGG